MLLSQKIQRIIFTPEKLENLDIKSVKSGKPFLEQQILQNKSYKVLVLEESSRGKVKKNVGKKPGESGVLEFRRHPACITGHERRFFYILVYSWFS